MTLTLPAATTSPSTSRSRSTAFTALTSVVTLLVLLQGLWAGIFLEHDGKRDDASTWIDVHARGADTAIALTLIALIVALVRIRSRRDLWVGSAVLAALLLVEAEIGGLIRDQGKDVLTAVHVPLGMAIMGLAVWLSVRSRRA